MITFFALLNKESYVQEYDARADATCAIAW